VGRRLVAVALLVALVACGGDDDDDDAIAAPTTTTTTASTTTTTEEVLEGRYLEAVFEDVDVTHDIAYGSAPGIDGQPETLLLDLYQPRSDTESARPLAIVVHGGGFAAGDKSEGVSVVMANHLAQLGYVVASLNYRLLSAGGCGGSNTGGDCSTAALEGIHDGQAAVRFLRANAEEYGIDPNRIAISGESAGGVIAYGAGTWSDAPGDSGTPGVSSEVQAFMSLSGGLPGGLFADAGDAPGLFFASTGDPIVPYQWSVDGVNKLTEAGVVAELITYDIDVHVPFREQRDDIIERTIDFYYEHLDLEAIT
jgi:dipeptidyl aminopeptidase/acylaminoacyl peptidase